MLTAPKRFRKTEQNERARAVPRKARPGKGRKMWERARLGGVADPIPVAGKILKLFPLKRILLICLVLAGCSSANSISLSSFIDNLQAEIGRTSPLVRLSVTQLASGAADQVVVKEQDRQCSSDPVLVFLNGDLVFDLKATVGGEGGLTVSQAVPAPTVKITGSSEHKLQYKVTPITLSNLPNVIFQGDVEVAKTLKDIKGAKAQELTAKFLEEAWDLRQRLTSVSQKLSKNWQKPATCPSGQNS